jgi:hypothetical protein
MSTRKVSPRKAAVLVGVVAATTVFGGPALAATQAAMSLSIAQIAAAPTTAIKRLSLTTGPSTGGATIMISGTGLATVEGEGEEATFEPKAVQFGTVTVEEDDVEAVSTTALEVVVPAKGDNTTAKVNVKVGDSKSVAYTYVSPDVTVSTTQEELDELTPSSDTGLTGVEIEGTNFESTTKVVVGGANAKATVTATKLTVAFPAGLSGVQDVVVTDPRTSLYVGHVNYEAKTPTISGEDDYTAIAEAATPITLTGTNLDAVVSAKFGTEKATVAKTTDPTKLVVTIPKGAAKTADLTLTTKYAKTATVEVVRAASATPTVTEVSGAVASGGNVTLTGTNLQGLKTVTVTNSADKAFKGSVVSVASATTATVKLPKLVADDEYELVVTTYATTGSTAETFTVTDDKPTVTEAAYDAEAKTLTLTGTYLTGTTKVVITNKATRKATTISKATSLVVDEEGTGLVVTLTTALADADYTVVVTAKGGTASAYELTTPTGDEGSEEGAEEGAEEGTEEGAEEGA